MKKTALSENPVDVTKLIQFSTLLVVCITFLLVLYAVKTNRISLTNKETSAPETNLIQVAEKVPNCTVSLADINGDRQVNMLDFSRLAACNGKSASETDSNGNVCALTDLNFDGTVDETDLSCIQSQFSKQYAFECTACKADISKNHAVNGQDASLLTLCWGKSASAKDANGTPCQQSDIDKNGIIGEGDVSCIKEVFGQFCSASGIK